MVESDFGKKTTAAETSTPHGKRHRTTFGKTTSERSNHSRTRANHHSKNRHQKGTTSMKRKASVTALVLLTATLVFFGGLKTTEAFGDGRTFSRATNPSYGTVAGFVTGQETCFTRGITVSNTSIERTLATGFNVQTTKSKFSSTGTPTSGEKWTVSTYTNRTKGLNTTDSESLAFSDGNDCNFNFDTQVEFFDETNQNFTQFNF